MKMLRMTFALGLADFILGNSASVFNRMDCSVGQQQGENAEDTRLIERLQFGLQLREAQREIGFKQGARNEDAIRRRPNPGMLQKTFNFLNHTAKLLLFYFATKLHGKYSNFVVMEIIRSLVSILNEMSPYILLGFLIAGIMHAFIPQRVFARHLSGHGWKSVVKSAAIGVPLPLCSCGVLPTAIGMRRNGASKAATTSFLIATPQTGMDSIAATWSLLGPAFAVVRPVAALVTALFGGMAVGRTEDAPAPAAAQTGEGESCCAAEPRKSFFGKCLDALRYGFVELVGSIGSWLVIGLIIAAIITVYVPADALAALGSRPLLAMIVVLLVAIPMYVCATGSIPIAMSLMLKGLSPGTALVLLMGGPAANFASFALISREMGRKSAIIYIGSIIVGAIAFGLAIDYLLPASWFTLPLASAACCHSHMSWPVFPTICSAILLGLLIYSFISHRKTHHQHNQTISEMTTIYNIQGMNCHHCRASVEKAIAQTPGVESVSVDLDSAKATVNGSATPESIISAVHSAGFEASLG